MKPGDLARLVARGYARTFRLLAEGIAVFLGMAAVAVCVSYPVWWLATHRRGAYTAVVLGGCVLLLGFQFIRRLASGKRSPAAPNGRKRFWTILVQCLFLPGAYGVSVLMARSMAMGVVAAAALIILFGIWTFGYGKPVHRGR